MKTTKATAALARLNKLAQNTPSFSKSSKAFRVAMDLITKTNDSYLVRGNEIRPCYVTGSGRHTSIADHSDEIVKLLSKIGIDCKRSNDAPRGGKTGTLLTVTTKILFDITGAKAN